MVAEMIPSVSDWRRDGCDERCEQRMVIVPGLLGRQQMVLHDPDAHERYGRELAGDISARLVLESGPLVLWRRELRLWVDGQEIYLTRTDWRILLALVDGNGTVVKRDAILIEVWGSEYLGEQHLLRVNLARIRAKLGVAAGLIETLYGIGYRFRFLEPGEAAGPARITYGRRPMPRGQWALAHERCGRCEGTGRRHYARGYCSPCYYKAMNALGAFGRSDTAP